MSDFENKPPQDPFAPQTPEQNNPGVSHSYTPTAPAGDIPPPPDPADANPEPSFEPQRPFEAPPAAAPAFDAPAPDMAAPAPPPPPPPAPDMAAPAPPTMDDQPDPFDQLRHPAPEPIEEPLKPAMEEVDMRPKLSEEEQLAAVAAASAGAASVAAGSGSKRKLFIILGILILLAVIGFVIFTFVLGGDSDSKRPIPSPAPLTTPAGAPLSVEPLAGLPDTPGDAVLLPEAIAFFEVLKAYAATPDLGPDASAQSQQDALVAAIENAGMEREEFTRIKSRYEQVRSLPEADRSISADYGTFAEAYSQVNP